MALLLDFSSSELTLFSEILWEMNNSTDKHSIRNKCLSKITKLLRADFGASYVLNPESRESDQGVAYNIDKKSQQEHDEIWCHNDPITRVMRLRRKPTTVDSVISRKDLEKTEFYNEFLRPNKMYFGINVYFVRDNQDIGDLRIWREKQSTPFGQRECNILNILEPYFCQTLPSTNMVQNFTPRECEIINLVSKGLADKEIANLLGIGHSTVRTHLKNLFQKTNCANRTELVRDIIFQQHIESHS